MANFKPVVFKVGEDEYGVDITLVSGIENLQPIVSVPNTGRHIKGIINLRGEVIPVFSLRSKFGMMETAATELTKLIIVQTSLFRLALEVDQVMEIHEVSELEIYEAPIIIKGKDTAYVQNVVNNNGELIIIIDVDNILSEDEKKEVEALIQ